MDTYRNIYFEVVQIGEKITIRASLTRVNFWGTTKVRCLYSQYQYCANDCSFNFNFGSTPIFWELNKLPELKNLANTCQRRYGEAQSATQTVLYSTKQVDNFEQINDLTLQLIAASKSGDDAAEKTILKQLETLHNVRS